MRPSRGMGDINPKKVPKMGIKSPKVGTRKDDDEVKMSGGGLYANIAETKKPEKIFKNPPSSRAGLKAAMQGGGGANRYGTAAGGRASFTYPLDDSTSIDAYLQGYGVKSKGSPASGKVTGAGLNLTKRFAKGGEVKMSGGGLYANIAAKKRRIASGSGESMKAAGAEGAPKKRDFDNAAKTARFSPGGSTKSKVNEAGNYTKPELRKSIFNRIKAGGKGGNPGQWSGRKAQMMAKQYKAAGGGYRD